jgi:hypothetical protein
MHPIRNILVLVSQGQDKFAFSEALTDIKLPLIDDLLIDSANFPINDHIILFIQ